MPRHATQWPPPAVAGALALLTVASLLLRTGELHAGYWIDEAISVGIASHDLLQIPAVLRQDGSPPLYYLLLHEWMALVGTGEAATRALSLLAAGMAVPVAWWAGRALFGGRAALLAAAGAAGCPFLTYYAQESRMYTLVALLSLLAAASFGLAFLHGRRRHVALLGVWLALLLYTHSWALFLVAAMALAWLGLRRRGAVRGRDGAWLAGALALAYAPWMPSLAAQALDTAAPWAARPAPWYLLAVPGGLFGYVAAPLLALAVVLARRRGPHVEGVLATAPASRQVPRDERARPGASPDAVRVLATVAATTCALAWAFSQLEPAWSTRYLAVAFGPLLLVLAGALARGGRASAALLAAVAAVWLLAPQPAAKSNVRAVAHRLRSDLRAGDLVVSTQPEQVPVLYRYLPRGVVYLSPLGLVADPRQTDWRDASARLHRGHPARDLEPLLDDLAPRSTVLLVTPDLRRLRGHSAWMRSTRARTREWRTAIARNPRLHRLGRPLGPHAANLRSAVRAELYRVS
jgi:mannosyltransferase